MYTSHENEKKTEYLHRVLQVEKANFTPLVFSTSGGMGREADKFIRRVAEQMSVKRKEKYCIVVSFIRCRYIFDLLRTCVISMRGHKKSTVKTDKVESLDLELKPITPY